MFIRQNLIAWTAAAATLLFATDAFATNGMNPISFDARSAGMGGADTALGLSTLSIARNPAAITAFDTHADLNLSLLVPFLTMGDEVTGQMTLNDGLDGNTNVFPLFGAAYAGHIYEGLYGGLGVFVQGGQGADFEDVGSFADNDPTNPLGGPPGPATYTMHSQVQFLKFAPTLAYSFDDVLSVAASLHIGMAKMEWRHSGMQFPEMDGDHVFVPHEVEFESDWAVAMAGRFGVQAALLDGDLRLGAAFMMQASPDFEGDLTLDNQLAYDGGTNDFGWPMEATFGVAGKLWNGRLTLSADVRWAQWSEAVDVVTFEADAKNAGAVPPELARLEMPFMMRWKDSVAMAVGAELAAIPNDLFVRLGYNYSPSVVGSDGINPLFPAVTEHHLTAGLGLRNIAGGLGLDFALEVALPNEVKCDDKNQLASEPGMPGAAATPNGYRVSVEMWQLTGHVMAGYAF